MDKPFRNAFLGIAVFLPLIFFVPRVYADGTCYAPVPVDCTTLSAAQCTEQDSVYQSEADIYNTCIADSYSQDAQDSATEARIKSYCANGGNATYTQSCIAEYNACQADAPANGFGSPNGDTCTYTCNTGYYIDVSGSCDAEGGATTQKPVAAVTASVTPTPVAIPAPAVVTPTPTVTTQTVVTQTVTPVAPVSRPKSIFAAIAQAVTPKASSAAPKLSVQVTTSATTTVAVPVVAQATTTQAAPKPVSFWGRVGSFFAKLNPFAWF